MAVPKWPWSNSKLQMYEISGDDGEHAGRDEAGGIGLAAAQRARTSTGQCTARVGETSSTQTRMGVERRGETLSMLHMGGRQFFGSIHVEYSEAAHELSGLQYRAGRRGAVLYGVQDAGARNTERYRQDEDTRRHDVTQGESSGNDYDAEARGQCDSNVPYEVQGCSVAAVSGVADGNITSSAMGNTPHTES